MFTGIVKEIGKVYSIKRGLTTKLAILASLVYKETNISDSVSINGVCLTVTEKKDDKLFFDVVSSTLEKTNLKRLKISDYVNIEPALKVDDKLGGHFVLGHIDCESKIKSFVKKSSFWQLEVFLPFEFRKIIVEEGSVALEGISLTVKKITNSSFFVDIIPFTFQNTNLKYKKVGDWLNIEFDYLLKKDIGR
ncbi:MAG: riboflavin synthase [Candidatus Omnitrophica bacterium]|nr:riboflavin synthase [Candidatus Omnitrophota bacterium]